MTHDTSVKSRVHLIDEVRGFAILCMVVYHFFFDLVVCFGVSIPIFHSPILRFLVDVFVILFVFISGSACAYSRNNIKRGLKCFGLGLILTVGTVLFARDLAIWFGILHMLGICMILVGLLEKPLKKVPITILVIGGIILFFITYHVADGYLGFQNVLSISLPKALYQTDFFAPIGFISNSFYSSDYFPLLPWLFCFFAGVGFGRLLRQEKMPHFFYCSHLKPLAFIGRHTLWIYLLHQPFLMTILYIVFMFVK